MRVERRRIESAGRDQTRRLLDAARINRRVALVGVDHVETTPVPRLHVDAARAVLMEARDHQAAAHARECAGEIQCLLLAGGLDHTVAQDAAGQRVDLLERVVGQRAHPLCAHRARCLECGRAP